jgi:16S rRNA (cytidine1402-2'-O)-methyltransferase
VTIVVAGASEDATSTDPDTLRALDASEEAAGVPRKQAIADVARRSGGTAGGRCAVS